MGKSGAIGARDPLYTTLWISLFKTGTLKQIKSLDIRQGRRATAVLPKNPKREERAPHPDPLPIGSADAEREKRSPQLDIGMPRLVHGFKARNRIRGNLADGHQRTAQRAVPTTQAIMTGFHFVG